MIALHTQKNPMLFNLRFYFNDWRDEWHDRKSILTKDCLTKVQRPKSKKVAITTATFLMLSLSRGCAFFFCSKQEDTKFTILLSVLPCCWVFFYSLKSPVSPPIANGRIWVGLTKIGGRLYHWIGLIEFIIFRAFHCVCDLITITIHLKTSSKLLILLQRMFCR